MGACKRERERDMDRDKERGSERFCGVEEEIELCFPGNRPGVSPTPIGSLLVGISLLPTILEPTESLFLGCLCPVCFFFFPSVQTHTNKLRFWSKFRFAFIPLKRAVRAQVCSVIRYDQILKLQNSKQSFFSYYNKLRTFIIVSPYFSTIFFQFP